MESECKTAVTGDLARAQAVGARVTRRGFSRPLHLLQMEVVMETVQYTCGDLNVEEFRSILMRSGLAERRPIADAGRLQAMLTGSQLVVVARVGDLVVGVARSVTDWSYCCYLSDLAVDQAWQRKGIGRQLVSQTRIHVGPQCTIVLVSAPCSVPFYERLDMSRTDRAFLLARTV